MNPLVKSSKWPSCDSLRSTPSFLLSSESEQTEDEADVLSSEGERESCLRQPGNRLSEKYFPFPDHSVESYCRSQDGSTGSCPDVKRPASPTTATFRSSSATAGDLAFAQKCADLRRFIRPLFELLNGLKNGRYDKGLTSFQQSVAMDRLQRILGVLQKPDMGERYLHTLLQVEMMLKLWFPQVAKPCITPIQNTTRILPSRWCQNQLHIPVKKRKLSWTDPEPSSTPSPPCKRHQQETLATFQSTTFPDTVSTRLPGAPRTQEGRGHELKDSTVALSRQSQKDSKNWKRLVISPPSPCSSPATQDGWVSSSSASPTTHSP